MLYNQKTKGIITMKNIQFFIIFLMLLTTFPNLQAQDFLQKVKIYLDAGECEKAQRAYDAYRVENLRNYDVEQRIEDCKTIKDKTFSVNGVSFKMIFVQGGTFQIGSYSGDEDEKPVHSVTVSDFYIGEFEVTQALWWEVMGSNIYHQRDKANTSWPMFGVGANYPMYYVSHSEAEEFCGRLNQRLRNQLPDGYSFALPTEAEWEYAARGGNKTNAYTYAGGNYLSDVGWNEDNSSGSTHAVGTKKANELGLYDMSGNVYEWCADWYGSYGSSSQTDPKGPYSGSGRVLRGGGWRHGATDCRVANRNVCIQSGRTDIGFRLALVRR